MPMSNADVVRIFKAFCDENRLKILEILRNGEKCACVLLEDLHITQPTLSHHMKILCDAGLVKGRKEGKWVHYAIDPDGAAATQALLTELTRVSEKAQNFGCSNSQ